MTQRRTFRSLGLALVVLVALIGGACSSDGDADADRPDGPDASAPLTSDPTDPDDSTTSTTEEQGDDLVRIGLVGIRSFDPAGVSPAAVSQMLAVDLVYDTLTEMDDLGQAVPGLATFTANVDRSAWRFEIDPEAAFADGRLITAADVVFSLERLRNLGGASLPGLQLEVIDSMTPLGAGTVDIVLREPLATFAELVSAPEYGIVDRDAVETSRAGGDPTPNGSAGYSATLQSSSRVRLERLRGSGPSVIDLVLFESADDAYDAFEAGDLDWAPVPPDRFGDAREAVGERGLVPFHGSILLGVNARVAPLDDVRLRRAIALAIDRAPLVEAVFGDAGVVPVGIVPVGVPGAPTECVEPCGPRPGEARKLVAEAFPDRDRVSLRLLIDDSDTQASVAAVIVQQLAAVGVDVDVSAFEPLTFDQLVAGGQQQLFLFSTLGVARSASQYIAPLFRSDSPDNLLRYENELVDDAIANALAEPIAAVRAARWRDLAASIQAEIPVVPLAQLRTVAALSDRLVSFPLRVDGSIDVTGIEVSGPVL